MSRSVRLRVASRGGAWVLLIAFALAACGDAASPSPEPILGSPIETPTATPTPTVTPTLTPSPSPTASELGPIPTRPVGVTMPLFAVRNVFTEGGIGVTLDHDASDADCPLVAGFEFEITACAWTEGPGGTFAVIVETFAGNSVAALYKLVDNDFWEQVTHTETYGADYPGAPWVSLTPHATEWVFAWNVIVVDILIGGSGAVMEYDVIAWPSAASEPAVTAHLDGVPHSRLETPAGWLMVTSSNFDDGAPTCCPNFFDFALIDLVEARKTVWTLATEASSPEHAALNVYLAFLAADSDAAAAYASEAFIDDVFAGLPGPLPDANLFHGPECLLEGDRFRCTFQNEAGVRHWLVRQVNATTYQVVEDESFAD